MEAVPQNDPDEEPLVTTQESQPEIETQTKCCACTPQRLVCVSHTLSAWGDRMWEFAVALYLVELTPGSLRLTAIFQLIRTLVVIFLGPFVGNWVDGNPRLRVAQLSLLAQNLAVAVSALLLLLILSVELSKPLFIIVVSLVIFVANISVLAGIATKVSIEKDWVVVISGGDKANLAGTNAVLRRIDLVCKIMAPALVGQIMTYVSKSAGVILIAAWNVVSVFFEYFMLLQVFRAVPALAIKKYDKKRHGDGNESTSSEQPQAPQDRLEWMERENGSEEHNADEDSEALVPRTTIRRPRQKKKPSVFQRFITKAQTMKTGCQIYMRQSVVLPGLALACLYFTVLSFGSITTGYVYTQKISESILSILRGVGSVLGVLATFVFPKMRNSLGLVRSGLFSMSAQFMCMLICLVAIFTPGSPFFVLPDSWRFHGSTVITHNLHNISNCSTITHYINTDVAHGVAHQKTRENNTTITQLNATPVLLSTQSFSTLNPTSSNGNVIFSSVSSSSRYSPVSSFYQLTSSIHTSISPSHTVYPVSSSISVPPTSPSSVPGPMNCTVDEVVKKKVTYNFSYISVSLLIVGIVLSRFGLWLSDLCITQLQQENVPEEERGIVGAMQKSFNSLLDMLMYIMVISLPKPQEFGILAIISVAAVGTGGILFARFSYKSRGHLFHFDKLKRVLTRGSSDNRGSSQRVPSREYLTQSTEEDDEADMINEVLTTRNENFQN